MPDHTANREILIDTTERGTRRPGPRQGEQIDCNGEVAFNEALRVVRALETAGFRRRDSTTGPADQKVWSCCAFSCRYVGYVTTVSIEEFSPDVSDGAIDSDNSYSQIADSANRPTDGPGLDVWQDASRGRVRRLRSFHLQLLQAESSMAVSFLADLSEGSEVLVEASGGRYQKKPVLVEGKERIWWLRQPVTMESRFSSEDILSATVARVPAKSVESNNCDGLSVGIEVYSRPHGSGSARLLTVCLINRGEAVGSLDEKCLFQAHFKVAVASPNGAGNILPYPSVSAESPDQEERSLALLYRKYETFGVGHGCAADWEVDPVENRAILVSAEALPEFETPSITPDVRRNDGTLVEVPMAALAGLVPDDDGFAALSEVVDLYERWVGEREQEISELLESHKTSASQHLEECRRCVTRMRLGLEYLMKDEKARKAFMLSNHAVLLQQICTQGEVRTASYDGRQQRIAFSEGYRDPSGLEPPPGRGSWRAFQVAFLLMAAQSAADGNAPDRGTVELIWFPTGGGKTEAYLGLAAFSIFMRRLAGPEDIGVQVLMRYTLRLLTAQQFQRASGLICAMEYLRRKSPQELGSNSFSIGIWLGGTTSPNRRQDAIRNLIPS